MNAFTLYCMTAGIALLSFFGGIWYARTRYRNELARYVNQVANETLELTLKDLSSSGRKEWHIEIFDILRRNVPD